ncbi:hypothetical protein ADEAN_000606300 [Angomonas deanei]|uniref:Uncharacterized protein n=1 Tax=Angomonas deanei TaxID=59799 RepID=A0A7G2CJY3_9TRYP|nr:hypothetical protein ADEAN_000606300 [Angomonas deanei]
MQFMEYYNTSRAVEDPDNQSMYVFSAYQTMLKQLYDTVDRPLDRIPLRYIHRGCVEFLEQWREMTVEERHALPIGLVHHKALNTIRIEDGYLVSDVLTGLQAKQYLSNFVHRVNLRRKRSHL